MREFNFYDWLYSIDGTANPRFCLVLNELPFFEPGPAIAFVSRNFPEMTVNERPVTADRDRCSEIARHSQHEVEYLITALERIADDLKAEAEKYETEAVGFDGPDLLSRTGREVNLEYAREKRNQAVGVMQAVLRLRSRLVELMRLAGKGRCSDWRI